MKNTFFIIFSLLCSTLYPQQVIPPDIQWEKPYGGKRFDEAFDAIEDLENHIVIVGQSKYIDGEEERSKKDIDKGGNNDLLFIKLNKQGGILKIKTIGKSKSEGAYSLVQTYDGGYAIAGYTNSPGDRANGKKDAWLIKVDGNGNFLWEIRTGSSENDEFRNVIQDENGNLILTGQKGDDLLAVKTDRFGKIIWNRTPLKTETHSKGNALVLLKNKDLIIVGKTIDRRKEKALFLRLNENGNIVGDKKIYGRFSEEAVDVLLTKENKIAILSRTYSRSNQDDIWVLMTDQSGNLLVPEPFQIGFRQKDIPSSFVESFVGDFYITGGSKAHDSNAKRFKFFLCQMDKTGQEQFANWEYYGGNYTDKANKILQLSDGSLLIAGHTFSKNTFGNNSDAWVIKFKSKGFPTKERAVALSHSDIRFFDNNEDQKLEPEEQGYITFKLNNDGDLDAFQIKAAVRSTNTATGLDFVKNINIGYLPRKSSKTISIPFNGKKDLIQTQASFEIAFEEANNAVIQPLHFDIETIATPKPELVLTNHSFSAGQKADRDVPITMNVTLVNQGNKKATNVRGVFFLGEKIMLESEKTIKINDLDPGESHTFEVTFRISKVYKRDETKIGFRYYASEENYFLGIENNFPLSIESSPIPSQETFVEWEWEYPMERDFRDLQQDVIPVSLQLDVMANIELSEEDFEVYIDGKRWDKNVKSGEEELNRKRKTKSRFFSFDYKNQILLDEGKHEVFIKVQKGSFISYSDTLALSYTNSVNLHLLAIGIGEYESTSRLKFTSKDVKDIEKIFKAQEGNLFDKVNTHIICDDCTDNETSKMELETAINKFFFRPEETFKKNDVVIVYISSHGKEVKGKFKILPSNYRNVLYDEDGSTYTVDFEKFILDKLGQLKTSHGFIFVDACHSGAIDNNPDLDGFMGIKDSEDEAQSIILKKLIEASKYVRPIMSCSDKEYSYEHPDWENGAFTEALIEAFENKKVSVKNGEIIQASADKVLTFNEIYNFLRLRVPFLVNEHSDYRGRTQTPYIPEVLLKESEDLPFYKIN